MIDPMEEFFFDLHGYTILHAALDTAHMGAISAWVDGLPSLTQGTWHGPMEVQSYGGIDGLNLQNIIEGGEIFERLIDHPAWIERVRHYLGEYNRPYINEAFLNLRGQGGYIGVHSGGWKTDGRVRSGVHGGQWNMQYMSIIIALKDIGPGDGATVLIPGSHKSSFRHPQQDEGVGITNRPGQEIEGIEEVYLRAGDVVLFDLRTLHRGGENRRAARRPMMYMTYMQEWYIDAVNFHTKQSAEFDDLPKSTRKLLGRIDAHNYVEYLEELVRDTGVDLESLQSVPTWRKVDL